MRSLPIVLIHRGGCPYLAGTVARAMASTPEGDIVILGDRYTSGLRGVTHLDVAGYLRAADRFAEVYRHRSTHEVEYELFCFQRWFALHEFMEAKGHERCLCLDTDVLLFADAKREGERFLDYHVTLSRISPHCMFISRRDRLAAVCEFFMECYRESSLFTRLESHYLALRAANRPGGVCDMSAFELFAKLERGRAADLSVIRDATVYDHSMATADGFETVDNLKRIRWSDDQPHGRLVADGSLVRFLTLHFQGWTKRSLDSHVRVEDPKLRRLYRFNRIAGNLGHWRYQWRRRLRRWRHRARRAVRPEDR